MRDARGSQGKDSDWYVRMNYPALLSFMCGFSSLSLEILWVRLYSFAKLSTPTAFGFVLAAYLIGIAFGAFLGSKICRKVNDDAVLWSYSIAALLFSAALSILLPSLFGWMIFNEFENIYLSLIIIACASIILALIFPIAHHLGADRQTGRQGQRFALVYMSNVIGAALGPLVTGYLLLDFLSLQQSYVVICMAQLGAAVFFALTINGAPQRRALAGAAIAVATGVLVLGKTTDPHSLIQQLNQHAEHAKTVIENRHGVITLFAKSRDDDAVMGGNVYDGRTNLNPQRNTNGLHRPLLLAALQPRPTRVLMVGLSVGTWLALINEFPGMQHVDVVEINPGYLKAAQAYPAQAYALRDQRVNFIVNDARRWLRMHESEKYDLVIMNTTWHWRSNASLLLSTEFLQLIKKHMLPGAVLAFNATGSDDAFFTASKVFKHAYRYSNFVYAADFDFRERKNTESTRSIYANLRLGNKPLFTPGFETIDKFLSEPFLALEEVQKVSVRPFELITDQNMITEFKYGRALY